MNDKQNIAVIIGATGGIGSQVARDLGQRGVRTHLIAQNKEKLCELSSELGSTCSALDASSFETLESDFKDLSSKGYLIDSVVNCSGSVILKPAHLTSQKEFDDTISKNLSTAFSTVRAGALHMTGGSIVLCSTAAVRVGLQNHEAIAAAKGGVEALVRSAASTYASKGIRVNAIAPGLTRTPMTEKITLNPQALAFSTAMHALGRIGEPKDISSGICWLLDSSQSWVTGQIIAIDGGLSSVIPKRT